MCKHSQLGKNIEKKKTLKNNNFTLLLQERRGRERRFLNLKLHLI